MALAVAVAIILSQVILLAGRILPGGKTESDAMKSEHPLMVITGDWAFEAGALTSL